MSEKLKIDRTRINPGTLWRVDRDASNGLGAYKISIELDKRAKNDTSGWISPAPERFF